MFGFVLCLVYLVCCLCSVIDLVTSRCVSVDVLVCVGD